MSAALAVLAIYVLTLLLPLHQAAGLQRDLGKLGYETVGIWSICQQIAQDDEGKTPTAVKCPATGIAKQEFAGILPVAVSVEPMLEAAPVVYLPVLAGSELSLHEHFGQARAPPVLV
ncbi:hypothetical protein GCM10011321_10670 [Youhaiella tibetensis]|jgi:hypothetical protein|uniref:Uncharacterized protein n=1 Tax=Paradevosia tibetensis TaxID=1447062 RepID=A0A5B9DNR9_9HYPH|nr:hypothetical protein [Youhaiella tibetensis]AKR55650.1 hypothetical protein XM25_07510 [Devosia sp. H5989]QEE20783.1 hypothetical protein FNA67_11625 [Youhaiella tibetensis]GGF21023.1 hypothetical protein GCM10011321_10670 [Youhaiella tibetensis]